MTAYGYDISLVRSGPEQYASANGAASDFAELTKGFGNPGVISGVNAWSAYSAYAGETVDQVHVEHYDGSVSERDFARLAENLRDADVIVAIGGGRVIDTSKEVANRVGVPLIAVPTIAATCAAWSPFTVAYDEHHHWKGALTHDYGPFKVVLDPALLVHSPSRYLLGGIGDTLAKWYEAYPLYHRLGEQGTRGLLDVVAMDSAKVSRDVILEHAEQAIADIDAGVASDAVADVATAIIPGAGLVGSLSRRLGSSGAHAIHNALTQVEGAEHYLHGEKVGYGILILLKSLHDQETYDYLRAFYARIGMPGSLEELGVAASDENIEAISAFAAVCQNRQYARAIPDIDAVTIAKAIREVEEDAVAIRGLDIGKAS